MAEKRRDDGRLAANSSSDIAVKDDTYVINHELGSDLVDEAEWKKDDGRNCSLSLLVKYRMAEGKNIVKELKNISCIWNFLAYWHFYTKRKQGQKMLDDIVKKYGCSVTVCIDAKDLYTLEVTGITFKQEKDLLYFLNHVLDDIYKNAKESLRCEVLSIYHRIWDDTLSMVKENVELQSAWIEIVGEHDPDAVYVVCAVKDTASVFDILTNIISKAKECYNKHEETVDIQIKWHRVLKRFEYLQEFKGKFPDVVIKPDKAKDAVAVQGPRHESKAAAIHLLEVFAIARGEIHETAFSPVCQFEILSYPEMCDYIDNSIPKYPIVWIPNNHTKTIHIFSKRAEEAKGIDKSIKGCIQQMFYPLSACHSLLPSEIMPLEELKKKHKGKIVIHTADKGLLVTTADDIFETVDAEIQEFVNTKRGTTTTAGTTGQEDLDLQSIRAEKCDICFDTITRTKKLPCGHSFHGECIIHSLKCTKICPICKEDVGELTGNQPMGIMYHKIRENDCLPGYSKYAIIEIIYNFPDGIQGEDHPCPGQPYEGTHKVAYLPYNNEGQKVYKLLRVAFNRKLVFTIAKSHKTGSREYIVKWNGIQHKTVPDRGCSKKGYPDDTYLTRVQQQLKVRGVTEEDILVPSSCLCLLS